ncbi:hypothetical protein B0H17DRAFT_1328907 [Mycena rosella]|uniref:Uncharacterized protein n=1 Tax=Mycena rosella TaxID=1033263 RepID=A0AAD7DRM4_MYCRO|nr:hypothetical protein B0H17DRAFT_1328907 [Mycena rosella]
MSSTPLTQLVSFLTRPLMRSHTPATIVALQLYLHTALAPLISDCETAHLLSPRCPPPPALQTACLLSGIRWAEWIQLLAGGLDVQLSLSTAVLAVQLGALPRRVIWTAATNKSEAPKAASSASEPRSPALRLRATLVSAHTRRAAALNPTRSPTMLSTTYSPASPSASEADSDSDSDYDSDSGSSFTSVSSATSVPSDSPPTNSTVTRYLYSGGITQVVSGRVMLGAPNAQFTPKIAREPAPKRAAFSNGRPSSHLPNMARKTADSWRRAA